MTAAHFDIPERSIGVAIFAALISALRWAILIALLVLFAPYALDYFDNARTHPAAKYVYDGRDYLLRTAGPEIRAYIPVRIAGKDRTDLILAVGLILAAGILGSIRRRVENASMRRRMRRQVSAWKRDMHIADNSAEAKDLERKIAGIRKGDGVVDRQELLKIFAETKKKLDTLGREVAFLSIDVVNSAAMKEREEAASVQYDFNEYRKLVENVFRARGVLKSTWTPDGVMACFSNVDEAVSAAKDVIKGLGPFNKNVKLMSRDFSVRCGVNAGFVHFDDATPLEAMSDRVIDIAGHMQKYAKPGSVAVARKVIEPLRNLRGFEPTEQVVDGYEVAQWVAGNENR
jgi:class 3 adenylate cyclase